MMVYLIINVIKIEWVKVSQIIVLMKKVVGIKIIKNANANKIQPNVQLGYTD